MKEPREATNGLVRSIRIAWPSNSIPTSCEWPEFQSHRIQQHGHSQQLRIGMRGIAASQVPGHVSATNVIELIELIELIKLMELSELTKLIDLSGPIE